MFFDEKKIKQRSGNNTIPAGKNHDDDGAGSFEKYFLPDLVIFFKQVVFLKTFLNAQIFVAAAHNFVFLLGHVAINNKKE